MSKEGHDESAFTEKQLRKYACNNLDDAEVKRQMDDDLLSNPDGEVRRYLRQIEKKAAKALNVNFEQLFADQSGEEIEDEL